MIYYNTSYRTPLATITCVIVRLTVILPEGAYACMSPKRRETWEPNGCDLMSENVNNDSSRLNKIHRFGSGTKLKLAGAFVLLSCGATHTYRHL